jgi:hypothetical protein
VVFTDVFFMVSTFFEVSPPILEVSRFTVESVTVFDDESVLVVESAAPGDLLPLHAATDKDNAIAISGSRM